MKVLFLDVDGVLNSEQSSIYWHYEGIENGGLHDRTCPIASSNLREILRYDPAIQIVVSSTWRMGETLESMRDILWDIGRIPKERVIGMTPVFRNGPRGLEIQDWLDRHPDVKNFVIVDDDSDMEHLRPHLILTSWRHGLMRDDALRIINRFAHPWKKADGIDLHNLREGGMVDSVERILDGKGEHTYWGLGKRPSNSTLEDWARVRTHQWGDERKWQVFVKELNLET